MQYEYSNSNKYEYTIWFLHQNYYKKHVAPSYLADKVYTIIYIYISVLKKKIRLV